MGRLECPGVDGNPAVRAGEAAFGNDFGYAVRRHRDQEVEGLVAAVLEHDESGLDTSDLRCDAGSDPARSELLGHPALYRRLRDQGHVDRIVVELVHAV
jgi:hypothetical protein